MARDVRSRDLAKQEFAWEDAKVLYTIDDGPYKGYTVVYLDNPNDTAQLGKLMGHCAGTHFIWTCEEKIWYFFAILGPNGQPHVTIHAKQTSWLNKVHPRDNADPFPVSVAGLDNYSYPSYADVVAKFEAIGQKYEAGKYKPLRYHSRTYDYGANGEYGQYNTWSYNYGPAIAKPQHVTQEQYDAYLKAWKAMADHYDKEIGAVKIEGRPFKFDGKNLTVLSFSGKGQGDASAYRKCFHDFLVSLAKKKKEVASGS